MFDVDLSPVMCRSSVNCSERCINVLTLRTVELGSDVNLPLDSGLCVCVCVFFQKMGCSRRPSRKIVSCPSSSDSIVNCMFLCVMFKWPKKGPIGTLNVTRRPDDQKYVNIFLQQK